VKQPIRLLQATILALMFCFGGSTHAANGRCLEQTPSEAFRKATMVFLGKVVSIQDPALPAAQLQLLTHPLSRQITVQFTVERVLQGTHVNEVKIQTITGAPESGYPFEVGEKYLVYANEIKGALVVGGCSRTRPAASAQQDLSFILGHNGPRNIAIKPEELSDLVRQTVSRKVKPAVGVISEPVYVLSDFNGDGFTDVAVVVVIEEGRDELKSHGVRYLDVDPFSKTNGREFNPNDGDKMGHNCLGLVLLHGSAKDWDRRTISDKFFIYDCFSSIRHVPKGVPIRRGRRSTGSPPRLKGDAIILDLESGAQTLVYWDGQTYRGFSIRPGD
jgi:hypothetical protein